MQRIVEAQAVGGRRSKKFGSEMAGHWVLEEFPREPCFLEIVTICIISSGVNVARKKTRN